MTTQQTCLLPYWKPRGLWSSRSTANFHPGPLYIGNDMSFLVWHLLTLDRLGWIRPAAALLVQLSCVEDAFEQGLNVVGGTRVQLRQQSLPARTPHRRPRPPFQRRTPRLHPHRPRFLHLAPQPRDRRLLKHRPPP